MHREKYFVNLLCASVKHKALFLPIGEKQAKIKADARGCFEGLKQSIKPGGTYSCAETAKDIEITMKTYKQIFYYKKYTMRGISFSTRF
ncbi:hypothetical protein DW089_08930 [Acidaminococcus sp. AM05-11]|jgi:hypothetical protein|uniref:hypothetical protein n=1 Tax=Acidaminococcus sp. AM05-11 TaxID=2291997 RepID=UPI000E4B8477|nr:hypothetical protein [Acidaminococcus sp. AM05-11]RHK00950.1 hypothetical protein DW089_08930 [Acidaminococcus sp. AM05-11]